jgi:hypothetical protein
MFRTRSRSQGERAYLALYEGRVRFSYAVVAVRVASGVGGQIALPFFATRFRVEAVAENHDHSPTVPTRWHDDAVAFGCIRLVDE